MKAEGKRSSAVFCFHAGSLFFGPEDGGDMFF
jgi:hypothetical protein